MKRVDLECEAQGEEKKDFFHCFGTDELGGNGSILKPNWPAHLNESGWIFNESGSAGLYDFGF